ncbi:MAG: hypothetical protein WKF34_04435 [Pyrinomonadaceae bacterium]
MKRSLRQSLCIVFIALALTGSLTAQASLSTITGTLTDDAGSAIAGANVQIINAQHSET